MVREGQVLFLMDAKPFKVQVEAQEAALARQQAGLEVARADLERTKPLAAQNALSQKDLDDANGQYLASAAAVEEAKARLETAKLNLSYCTIVSPVTGITGPPSCRTGRTSTPEQPPDHGGGALADLVNFSLSRTRSPPSARRSRRASYARRRTGASPSRSSSWTARSSRTRVGSPSPRRRSAPRPDLHAPGERAEPDGILRPNAYVRVRLVGAVRPDAIVVPSGPCSRARRELRVGGGQGGKARPRPVEVGKWQGSDWLVSEGLHSGDQVIVDGTLALHAGAPVAVKPAV